VNSVTSALSGFTERLHARRQERHDDYVFCPEDRFWFRPAYTEGKCPLCGEVAPGGFRSLPLLQRMDRSWFGIAGLVLESLGMLALVMFMYFRT
jgi:hypothetical protein